MRRRSRAGGEQVKARRRKTVTPKRRNAPKAVRLSGSSTARKARQKKVTEEVIELDRKLLRKLRDDPLGSSKAALDEVMEIYASERLAKR